MLIKNGLIVSPGNQLEQPADLRIRNGIIETIAAANSLTAEPDEQVLDASSLVIAPGLIDIHFHGCKGYDFCDGTKEAIEEIARYEASIGVTAISPATMTLPVEELERILSVAASYNKENREGADLVGINIGRSVYQQGKERRTR